MPGTLQVTATPDPFEPPGPVLVEASGGTPPYVFTAASSPPNPGGVGIDPPSSGGSTQVVVPAGTPAGAYVTVNVRDSSSPPKVGSVTARTS